MLVIHRQKFDPTARYVLARDMRVGGVDRKAGEAVPFPTADVSLEAARCMWKERILVPAPPRPPAPTQTRKGR